MRATRRPYRGVDPVADVQYHGLDDYESLFYRVAAFNAPHAVLGAMGSDLQLSSVGRVTTGQRFTADLPICLPNLNRFKLFLDIHGNRIPPTKRVFLTRTRHDGDLNDELPTGWLAGGDAICQARADEALLGGTWTAWLSAPGVPAASRITDSAYVWLDGRTLVATSLADLTDGNLINPIIYDEWRSPASSWFARSVWTGTTADGAVAKTCNAWTSTLSLARGTTGESPATDLL